MENRIPLPTDNIYKFYALFGLLLTIFGIGATLYINKSTNDLVFEIGVEYESLKADPVRTPKQEIRYKLLQRKLEIATKDKNSFLIGLSLVIGIGVLMVGYGFKKWHLEIQPIQDEIARLNLKKLKREVGEDENT